MEALAQDLPPQVKFKEKILENRDATLEKGSFVGRPVDYVYVSPPGSKDCIELEAVPWLSYIRMEARKKRFPAEWVVMLQEQYDAWKKGTPAPTFGTPLSTWKHVTPNVLAAIEAARISTIEELALANEDTIARLGPGARALKNKAVLYTNQQPIPENLQEVAEKAALLKED